MAKKKGVVKKKRYETISTKYGLLKITHEFLREVASFSSHGIKSVQLMEYYGLSTMQWHRLLLARPEIEEAIARGKVELIEEMANMLIKKAREGNIQAVIFYLKTQGGWGEGNGQSNATPIDKPEINYTITTTDPIEAARIYQKIMTGSS